MGGSLVKREKIWFLGGEGASNSGWGRGKEVAWECHCETEGWVEENVGAGLRGEGASGERRRGSLGEAHGLREGLGKGCPKCVCSKGPEILQERGVGVGGGEGARGKSETKGVWSVGRQTLWCAREA